MRFIKVFLSAVFLFAFFIAHAQPITGAFGYKLGQHIPSCNEKDTLTYDAICMVKELWFDFFDRVEIKATPESKLIYEIIAVKDMGTNPIRCIDHFDEYKAVDDLLKKRYGKIKHKILPGAYEYKGREIRISHCSQTLDLIYRDKDLEDKADLERKIIKHSKRKRKEERKRQVQNKKIEELKKKIEGSNL